MFEQTMFETTAPLAPFSFFRKKIQVSYFPERTKVFSKAYLLPSFAKFLEEENFAEVFLGWNEKGLYFHVEVAKPFEDVSWDDIRKTDSFEVFLDTRDNKKRRFVHAFCHHFVFLPQEVEGHAAKEMTRFRGEDAHDLCNEEDLFVSAHFGKSSYVMDLHIPHFCLHGCDPNTFPRLGFTFRCNRKKYSPQHFDFSSEEFPLEQNPHLWSSLELISKVD